MGYGKRDLARLGPAAQRQILEERLKSRSGGSVGDIIRKAERDGIRKRAEAHIPYKGLMIDRPCEIKCLFYMRLNYSDTKRKIDLTNLLEAVDDALVAHHLLADDNCRIIVSHDGSRVLHDPKHPRTEVTIRLLDAR